MNAAAAAAPPAVQLVSVAGRELLFYPAPQRPLVALLRGTTADAAGNISFEREPLPMNQLDQARALGCGGVLFGGACRRGRSSTGPRMLLWPGAVECLCIGKRTLIVKYENCLEC